MAIFIKFPDGTVKGQSQVDGFTDTLEVESFQFGVGLGVSAATTNQTRSTGHPSFSEVTVSRLSDSATPQLLQHLAGAVTLAGDTTITFTREDKGVTLSLIVIKLTDVILSGVSISSGGDGANESVSLNYAKITVEYTKQKEEGGKEGVAPFGWDISLNKPV
ncbi:MAG: type VI secretion system tube protein Hcp [Burkholderiaceae bacterium]|nr:type VI secretion system tube protein Hcp [Burkholderiaceae bacterium]